MPDTIGWWNNMVRCWGKKKDGQPCKNYARKGYEISPGNLFIPMTCFRHIDQEEDLRRP